MATYAPFGALSIVEWVVFGFMIWILVILGREVVRYYREAVWYRRNTHYRPRLDTLELVLDEVSRGLVFSALFFGAFGILVWYTLPFPLAELVNYGGPVSYVALIFLEGLAVLLLLAAFVVWVTLRVVEYQNNKESESVKLDSSAA